MAQIYLDYNASMPIDPAVATAMQPFLAFGNPSSGHWASTPAKAALENAAHSALCVPHTSGSPRVGEAYHNRRHRAEACDDHLAYAEQGRRPLLGRPGFARAQV